MILRKYFAVLLVWQLVLGSALALPANVESERLARWQLNYAGYLVDVGKYLEALEYVDSAYEVSTYPKTRQQALATKAMVLATFLDDPGRAVATYSLLAKENPEYREMADYQIAFLYSEMGQKEKARQALRSYLDRYPSGRYRFQAEAVLQSLGEAEMVEPAPPVQREPLVERPELRVALGRKARSLTVEAPGGLVVDGRPEGARLSIKPGKAGLAVNGVNRSVSRLEIRAKAPITVTIGTRTKRVRGRVVVQSAENRLLVLNLVDIEEYLRSVVPSESYASWPLETLKAQAIAARTYAYYQKLHRTGWAYDLVDYDGDQVYGGVDKEHENSDLAVRKTAGMILVHGGKPILSQYTSNSGGYTADAGAVFGAAKPYLVAHPDPASTTGKMATWTRRYTEGEIVAALGNIGVDASGLTAIEPVQVGPSGRMIKVRLRHAHGSSVLRTRTTLASSRVLRLPEVLISVDRVGDSFVFHGRGYGHGVGYSQWGGAELGKTRNAATILDFYYPSTTLKWQWE